MIGDDERVPGHRRPARRRRDPRGRRRPRGQGDRLHPRPRRPRARGAGAARRRTGAPILLHPDDRPLWELTHGGDEEGAISGTSTSPTAQTLTIGGAAVTVMHTPGHAPGRGLPLRPRPGLRVHRRHPVPGRPGATGRSFSDADLTDSIRGGCSRCRTRPSCTPATVTTPRSVRSARASPAEASGRPALLEPGGPHVVEVLGLGHQLASRRMVDGRTEDASLPPAKVCGRVVPYARVLACA